MAKKSSLITPSVAEDVELLELSYTAGRSIKWYKHVGNQFEPLLKMKYTSIISSSHSTPRYLLKRNESIPSYKGFYKIFIAVFK